VRQVVALGAEILVQFHLAQLRNISANVREPMLTQVRGSAVVIGDGQRHQ